MSGEETTTETSETETETTAEQENTTDAVLDAEAVEQQSTEALRETVEEQADRIDELEDLLLDLSTRVADGNSMGVCPDCHGPVVKIDPWLRSARIKCTNCERVFHQY
jgi:hypothetical protein